MNADQYLRVGPQTSQSGIATGDLDVALVVADAPDTVVAANAVPLALRQHGGQSVGPAVRAGEQFRADDDRGSYGDSGGLQTMQYPKS